MYRFHRYNLIRWDISSPSVAYKLFVRGLYDYVIVKEETSSSVTTRGYFVASKAIESSWSNRALLTYSEDIQGRKLVNEGQNWLTANGGGEAFTGLLDDYGGAMVAYSLRKLSSSYTGAAVTVRRASDNNTQDIGFVNNQLDTASLAAFCSGTNGFISVWYDQSGNGRNAAQTVAAAQPKIYDTSGGVISSFGKPSIEFDGVADWLNANYSNSQFSQLFTVKDTLIDISVSVIGFSGAVNLQDNRYNTLADDIEFDQGDGLFVVDNLNVKGYVNNIDKTNGATTFTQTFNRLYLGTSTGTSSFSEGFLSEVIIYPFATDQSSNRVSIQNNINDFYSIY